MRLPVSQVRRGLFNTTAVALAGLAATLIGCSSGDGTSEQESQLDAGWIYPSGGSGGSDQAGSGGAAGEAGGAPEGGTGGPAPVVDAGGEPDTGSAGSSAGAGGAGGDASTPTTDGGSGAGGAGGSAATPECTQSDLGNCTDQTGGLATALCCTPEGLCGYIFDLGAGQPSQCVTDQLPGPVVTQECEQCARTNCPSDVAACEADADCQSLSDCLMACTDLMSCAICGLTYQNAAMGSYGALATCALNACPSCSEVFQLLPGMGGAGGAGGGGGAGG